ncbi:MAG TPA: metalloregulator ArsR/SmtB family transcription factor [Verrucomicrobiae bacterium]|nr:metalloregulator ArsR/SmtB family transcription factor [Verrucomicrobiae bacterium]
MRDLVLFYAALSDETRLRLLCLMRSGEVCVCHLQGVLKTNQPKISRHLAYLRKAGLVETRRDGRWTHYRLKRLEGRLERILSETVARLKVEPQVKKDLRRLKQVAC